MNHTPAAPFAPSPSQLHRVECKDATDERDRANGRRPAGDPCDDDPVPTPNNVQVDLREALFNDGAIGMAAQIAVPAEMITALRGILIDQDLKMFISPLANFAVPTPKELYDQVVGPWLERDPLLKNAEVRDSGNGLHVILRFDPAFEFVSQGERDRWAALVKVVQRVMPSDPNAPGITALTRPVGSVNSKCGRTVTLLAPAIPFVSRRSGLFLTVSRGSRSARSPASSSGRTRKSLRAPFAGEQTRRSPSWTKSGAATHAEM